MKVIIAEDEFLERKAMRKFLESHFPDIEIVAEAINGRQAIELAAEHQPDLILMDIKMPGLSGLEAMEKIHQARPSIKFIMITAYDTFEYAKQAMKYGVKDYILKPSTKEETIRAILHMKKEITEEKTTTDQRQTLFLTKVMQGEEAEDMRRILLPEMKSGFFFVLSEYIPLSDVYLQEDKVGFHGSSQVLDKATVLTQMRQLQLRLGNSVYIGVGHPYQATEDLTNSYLQAKQALRHLTEAQQKKYGFPPKTEETTDIEPLLEAIKEGNEERVWTQFEVVHDQLDIETYYKIKQLLEEKNCHVSDVDYEQLEWRDFIQMVCLEIRQYFHSQNKIARAKQYMEAHFQENINLEDLATHTELSSNYLSNLFRMETGMTITDYLTEIRINKAKEMLQQNHASLKEISIHIGYRDPNYFSRVFKKQVGQSPKQYQNQILK